MSKQIIYAGVTPYAYNPKTKKTYILLGYEEHHTKKWDKGWSGFGGGLEEGEDPIMGAAREGSEESMGFLGTTAQVKKFIEHPTTGSFRETTKSGRIAMHYMIKIPYDHMLPKYFNGVYRHVKQGFLQACSVPEGYLEKIRVKWFSLDDLQKVTNWRPSFQSTAKILLTRPELQ